MVSTEDDEALDVGGAGLPSANSRSCCIMSLKFLTILDSVAGLGMPVHFCLLDETSEEGDNRV